MAEHSYDDLQLEPLTEHYCRACGEPVGSADPDHCSMVDRLTAGVDVVKPGTIAVVWTPSEAPSDA